MTTIVVHYVDVYVARRVGRGWRVLALRRAPERTRGGSWETIHGRMEPGETPVDAARRELSEETGLTASRLYNLSRVEAFYEHGQDRIVLIPAFAAVVTGAKVRLSDEHDRAEWLTPARAARRWVWPRSGRAVRDLVQLLKDGSAGSVEDVLRIG